MNSLILRVASRLLLVLLLLVSVFLLLRGHHLPGGGFVGGLVAAGAWALYGIAHGTSTARYALVVDPRGLAGTGLMLAILSGLIAAFFREVAFKGYWIELGSLKLGSPMLFDVGVYLVVMGSTLTVIFALLEEA